jgi:hypothetical protein
VENAIASRAQVAGDAGLEVHVDQIRIYPEIAAQIYGYFKSDLWDHSQTRFMLVDVGGGTVDGSIFTIREDPKTGDMTFGFLSSAVGNLGAYILHRERLAWHVEQLESCREGEDLARDFKEILNGNLMPSRISGDIRDYMTGVRYPDETADEKFYRRFSGLMWNRVIMNVKNSGSFRNDAFENLPFLLCGGGRAVNLYNKFISYINRPGSTTSVSLREIEMRKPSNLTGEGVGNEIYQRLSVAYGLSFLDIGEIITPDSFPAPPDRKERDYREGFIDKDQV